MLCIIMYDVYFTLLLFLMVNAVTSRSSFFMFKNGNSYIGEWGNGIRSGLGMFVFASGSAHLGQVLKLLLLLMYDGITKAFALVCVPDSLPYIC
jgi:hypothetical protein